MSLVCLSCKLAVCDESDRQCLFNRTDYFQTYYQIHRDRKNEAAKSRYHELKQNPDWRERRNERERQRRKYASTNLSTQS